jgi:uncharacterized protein involved in type VI secretion and phage assembly
MNEIRENIKEKGVESFGRFYSIYRAYCIDNQDPDNMGRIKVLCPVIFGEVPFGEWVHSFGMVAGASHGIVSIPSIGDAVNVLFESGDIYSPVWTYGWFGKDEMPEEAKGRYDEVLLIKTKGGQMVFIDDKEGSVKIQNTNGDNVLIEKDKVTMDAKKVILSGDAEKAVLGDKLEKFFGKLIDTISEAKDLKGTPFSPDDITALQKLKLETKTFLSENVSLK